MFEEYRLNKKQSAENWGKVLFFEDFPWASYSTAHYDTFIKVDTFYYKAKDIQPNVWLQNIKIVRDTNGLLEDVLERSAKLSYSPSLEEVELWRTKFFAYVHEAYRRIMRKEILYALNCLDWIRWSIVSGWYMEMGYPPNNPGDWAKIEGSRSKLLESQLDLLEQWHSSREQNEIMNTINQIVPEFKKVHKRLCEKVGMEENSKWVEEILAMALI